MSDQEDKKTVEQGDADVAESVATAPDAVTETIEPPPLNSTPQPPRKSFSAVAWLALLLTLGMAGLAGWLLPQVEQERDALSARLDQIENSLGKDDQALSTLETNLNRQLSGGLAQINSTLQSESRRLSQSLLDMESQLAEQRAELGALRANDRGSWLMAEAEYLLRLANQRLIMAGDTVAARALLNSADGVLRELDDISMHKVRAAVAADLAAVRAVPTVDTQGIYLRLSALIEQADELVIFAMPEGEAMSAPPPAEDWQDRLRQGYAAALQKLSDYIVIRRRDVPMQALMDPQWESLVRQNLRMLMEQAQVALLSGNQSLYGESLERAQKWVAQFQDSDEVAASAMSRELVELASLQIAVEMPDISRSLRALDASVEQRLDEQEAAGE